MTATEDRYTGRNRVVSALAVGALIGALVINATGWADSRTEVVQIKGTSSSLAADTLACTDGTVPNSNACQAAAQKAAQVQQTPPPVTINVPRRTDAEIRDLIAETIRRNPDLVPRGPAGETPEIDYERIISAVQGRMPTPADGKPGETPVVDYDKIVSTVLAQIPKPKDGAAPPCLSEPRQCRGADSTVAGPEGKTGPPPLAWRWVEHTLTGDVEHFCGRDPGSPDTEPTYTCS